MNFSTEAMTPYINSSIQNNICYIEFFTPKHNALNSNMLDQLANKIEETPEHCAVIVLSSGGDRTFCAGASFDELSQIKNQEEATLFFNGFAKVILSIKACPQIVIVSVQGKAVGGGVGIIAAADYAIASENAALKLSELNIGIGPFVIAPAIVKKSGINVLTEMSLNPDNFYSAKWAKQKGLFHKVCENQSDLKITTNNFANKLASFNVNALKAMKHVFWENTEHWPELLEKRAETSGSLVLEKAVQDKIRTILSKS